MESLRRFAERELALHPEQVQLFTPAPSTLSTLMYCTGRDPISGQRLFVEKTEAGRELQKKVLVAKSGSFMRGKSEHQPRKHERKSGARTPGKKAGRRG
jgi:radical SAM superfamily enzyme YgiQ (UPF0313 family)